MDQTTKKLSTGKLFQLVTFLDFSSQGQGCYLPTLFSSRKSEVHEDASQITFACPKSTIETPENDVKYVQTEE